MESSLEQMQALKRQVSGALPLTLSADPRRFADIFQTSLDSVNHRQIYSDQLQRAFIVGAPEEVDLQDVVLAMQKASLSFQMLTQARNRLVSAYQEILNMPV